MWISILHIILLITVFVACSQEKKGVSIYVVLRHQFSITYGFHPINTFFSNKLACNTVILPATLFEELLDWYFYNVGNEIPA